MRYTEKRNGKNVIPLRNAVCGVDLPKWSIDKHSDIQSFLRGDAVDRLAELEDKIEQGKMIELPCKVGDTIWCIDGFCDGSFSVAERKVTGFTIERERILLCAVLNDLVLFTRRYDIINIGKTVFLTREEAEKRLKELQDGNI